MMRCSSTGTPTSTRPAYPVRIGPQSGAQTFSGPIHSITSNRGSAGVLFAVGVATSLWSASGYIGIFIRASNVIYETEEGRSFWKLRPLQLAVTLAMVIMVAAVLLALLLTGPVVRAVADPIGVGNSAVTVWNIAHQRFTPAFLILGWAHLALISARNIPLFGIVAAPIVAAGVDQAFRNLRQADVAGWVKRLSESFAEIGCEVGEVEKHWRVHAASVIAVLLLASALHASLNSNKFRAEYDPKRYPAKALDAIVAGGFAKHIFTDDEWGDYLIFRLYPTHKVFIDGRSDFYGASFGEKYLDVMNVKYDWEQYLKKYDIDTILLATTSPLAGAIKESRHWRPVYDDTIAIIFRPVGNYSTEEQGFSTAVQGGKNRDPRITIAVPSDPEITKDKQLKGDKT